MLQPAKKESIIVKMRQGKGNTWQLKSHIVPEPNEYERIQYMSPKSGWQSCSCRTHRILRHIYIPRVPVRIFPDLFAFASSQANPLCKNGRLTAENINPALECR